MIPQKTHSLIQQRNEIGDEIGEIRGRIQFPPAICGLGQEFSDARTQVGVHSANLRHVVKPISIEQSARDDSNIQRKPD